MRVGSQKGSSAPWEIADVRLIDAKICLIDAMVEAGVCSG